MKTLIAGLICLASVLLFVSCQREVDERIDIPPSLSGDSTLLEKYIELDTTLPSGADTVGKSLYSYDAQKRVKSAQYISNLSPWADTTWINYYYSANDTLPYKYVAVWSIPPVVYIDTVFLWYTNGLVSTDSTIEYDITNNQFFGTAVTHFSSAGNATAVLKRDYFTPGPGAPIDREWSGIIQKTYQNNCIVTQDDNGPTFVHSDRAHYRVTYDTHVNPFYKVEIPYPVLNKWIIQKNNVLTSSSWDIPSQFASDDVYSYTYNEMGYPVIMREKDMLGGRSLKCLFFYTD